MAVNSSIEWTNATWNPIAGCSIVSAGCTNCYAMRMAERLGAMGQEKYAGLTRKTGGRAKWTGIVRCDEKALSVPNTWRRSRVVFVNSMADLFHEGVPTEFIRRVWQVMADTPQHTYQILTKRPERIRKILSKRRLPILPNVWIGTSVENADVTDRIELLRQTPSAVRFLSAEPLVGPLKNLDLTGIDWVIVGGESGPGARPMKEKWVWQLLEQCRDQGVAFFFKQWGGRNKKAAGRLLGGRTYDEMPKQFRGKLIAK